MSRTEQPDRPATFAEGVQVPTTVPESPEAAAAISATPPPTRDDYAREHGTWRATGDCMVGSSVAVRAGGSVPASHPSLPRWRADGLVEPTGRYDVDPLPG